MEDTGLYTVNGEKIVTDNIDNSDPQEFEDFIEKIKIEHPIQWLNMMSTNLDALVHEYNETAFEHGEPIIAAVFVDRDEENYENYRELMFPTNEMEVANAEDKGPDVQEEAHDGGSTGRSTERSEG